jgi:pyruvate dehydrogenase E2 component (dihydrolipoamide acetyltransferase)
MTQIDVRVPDIGDFHDIPVIELLVSAGQRIAQDAPLVTLESDKATMEVPSPQAGTVRAIAVKVGDKVSEGSPLLTLDAEEGSSDAKPTTDPSVAAASAPPDNGSTTSGTGDSGARPVAEEAGARDFVRSLASAHTNHAGPESHPIARPDRDESVPKPHASPVVRKYARELGVDLARVQGSGPKERIVVEDVQGFVRAALSGGPAGAAVMQRATIGDFARVEGEVDIASLEGFRAGMAPDGRNGAEVPLLAFVVKGIALALAAPGDGTHAPAVRRDAWSGTIAVAPLGVTPAASGAATARGVERAIVRSPAVDGVTHIAQQLAAPADADAALPAATGTQGAPLWVRAVARPDAAVPPPGLASWLAVVDVGTTSVRPVWDGARFAPHPMLPLAIWADRRMLDDAAVAALLSRVAAMLADLRRAIL